MLVKFSNLFILPSLLSHASIKPLDIIMFHLCQGHPGAPDFSTNSAVFNHIQAPMWRRNRVSEQVHVFQSLAWLQRACPPSQPPPTSFVSVTFKVHKVRRAGEKASRENGRRRVLPCDSIRLIAICHPPRAPWRRCPPILLTHQCPNPAHGPPCRQMAPDDTPYYT